MKYLIGILLLACSLTSFAQNADKPLVQFSGIIYNADNNSVVPYVTVTNVSNGKRLYQNGQQSGAAGIGS